MRRALTVLSAAATLLLTACGGDGDASASPTTATATVTVTAAPEPPDSLIRVTSQLCDEYCDALEAWPTSCPGDARNLTICAQPMETIYGWANDIQAGVYDSNLELFDLLDVAPQLVRAYEQMYTFYDDWHVTPVGQVPCSSVSDISTAAAPVRGRCASASSSMGSFAPYLAEQLRAVGQQ
jgi:hypothetical protein